jgi:D-alanyl-D-alanine carboxypeptidase/D-alanyl-D-alanine-endopeptidase (penicillin-binding protein 4)
VLLVLAVLAAAFGSFQYDVARRLGWADDVDSPAQIQPPEGVDLPDLAPPAPVADPLPASVADPAKVRAALAAYLRDDDLGRHVLASVATADGTPLFRGGARSATPASTMKLLTGTAALEALGPETTLATRVVQGKGRREIVLVGGGDPYLSAAPGTHTEDPPHADLRTLGRATADALTFAGTTSVRLRFDDSLFTGPTASPAWPASYTAEAVVAPITALWVEQGAKQDGWGFEADPSRAAADAFAAELRKAGIVVRGTPARATAADDAVELARVESAPMRELVAEVLASSDNEGAELLAHHVGIAEGAGGSFDGGVEGVTAVLARLGVALRRGDVVHDGSGLSREDRLTDTTLLGVLALGADDTHPELRTLVTGLPVAGFTGSLGARFVEGAPAGRGRVAAKTGTLTGVHGLAGVATDQDGNVLLFAFVADKVALEDTLDARDSLDRLAAALGACHCS